jgi:WD40 repeat protein
VRLWNTRSGTIGPTLLAGIPNVSALFSPDGRWLSAGTPEDYRVWETGSWKEVARLERPRSFSNLPGIMAFSPDSTLMATKISQREIRLLRTGTTTAVAELEMAEPQAFTSFNFSPDGRLFVATTHGNRIHVWNLARIRAELRRLGLDQGLGNDWPAP